MPDKLHSIRWVHPMTGLPAILEVVIKNSDFQRPVVALAGIRAHRPMTILIKVTDMSPYDHRSRYHFLLPLPVNRKEGKSVSCLFVASVLELGLQ